MPVPETVRKIRRREPRLRVKHGVRREDAGKRLVATAKRGDLTVYSIPDPKLIGRSRSSIPGGPRIVVLARGVLDSLVLSRGTLPDHAHRPSLRMCGGDKQLLFALETGFLAVKKTEFEAWYRAERRRGKWPSQRSQTKRPLKGRPAKETDGLRRAIVNRLSKAVGPPKQGSMPCIVCSRQNALRSRVRRRLAGSWIGSGTRPGKPNFGGPSVTGASAPGPISQKALAEIFLDPEFSPASCH